MTAPIVMSGGNPLVRRPVQVLVPVLGLVYVGILVVIIATFESPPTSASNPYPIIADVLALIELAAAFLIWRGMRLGYVLAAVMNVVFLVLFSGDLGDGLTGFADVTIVEGASSHYPGGPFFSPANLTVKVGKTVTWVNKDTVTHTVTSDGSSLFDSGFMPTGATFQFTFTAAGTYPYYCTVHPYMKGTIVVTP